MDSQRIAAALEHEFPVRIEWLGKKSFFIVFRPEISRQEIEEMKPRINARMRELMRRKNGGMERLSEIMTWIWEHVFVKYMVWWAIGALFIIIVVAVVEILSYPIAK